jgi:hypothetical protein
MKYRIKKITECWGLNNKKEISKYYPQERRWGLWRYMGGMITVFFSTEEEAWDYIDTLLTGEKVEHIYEPSSQ